MSAPAAEQPWIEWAGGECPVEAKSEVDVRFDDGVVIEGVTAGFWSGDGTDDDPNWFAGGAEYGHNITAYRVVSA